MPSKVLTWEEIKSSEKDTLCCAEVSKVIGCDPNTLRWQAQEDPLSLGFPVILLKNSVRIPRLAFINFMEGKT